MAASSIASRYDIASVVRPSSFSLIARNKCAWPTRDDSPLSRYRFRFSEASIYSFSLYDITPIQNGTNGKNAVERYFEGRPNKLFRVCWDDGDGPELLTRFLGMPEARLDPVHINKSPVHVYDGDNLFRAHVARLHYQWLSGPKALPRRALRRFLGA